ncbi:MAG: cyclopropane-fatty-acyl-phospholipid synthase family protein [Rickettsiales bacterium]|nr:cyclopropane-fatty-acyl-phospholipid synthase family protein [Rickettsiales bacterium]
MNLTKIIQETKLFKKNNLIANEPKFKHDLNLIKNKNYDFIWQALSRIDFGSLKIVFPDGSSKEFQGKNFGPNAEMEIKNYDLIDAIITGGDVALGECYMQKMWESSNLPELLTFFTLNSHALEDFFHARKFQALLLFLKSFFSKNTKRGSKKNIAAHYDLGNDFYELWLDQSMTYSSALFIDQNDDLQKAQKQKYQNILAKLTGNSILEIGCGWGGFAEIASQNNYKVTCLTLSSKQKIYAQNRIRKINAENLVEIKLQDYRDEKAVYDNVVSIEMFEAVGQDYWDKYFQTINNSLKTSGIAVLQIITIDEQVFKDYINRVDFIQKHIFPGGILPAKTTIRDLAKKHNFAIKSETNFGFDYAKTLLIWLKNFDQNHDRIKALGFSEEFIRKWRFYLSYCAAGFSAKRTDVIQFELLKL